ncbi:hypothetical protein [Nocardioides sp. SYSU DS0663]
MRSRTSTPHTSILFVGIVLVVLGLLLAMAGPPAFAAATHAWTVTG